MKKVFLFAAMCCFVINLWAGNTITYTASAKLPEVTENLDGGLHVNAFNAAITSHTFFNGTGTIVFADELTAIKNRAFYKSSDLTSIDIPNSVITIGDYAFVYCENLASINVDIANTHYVSEHGVLFSYAKDTLIQYPIGNLRTEYTITNSVTTIGDCAFYRCTNLTLATIPNSVTTIGTTAFYMCYNLTSITIPGSITKIKYEAFYGCVGLTSITSCATIPPTCDKDCFGEISSTIPVYVPSSSIAAYQSADGWKDFTNIQAYTKNYNLFVKGEQVTFDNSGDILGDGTVSYDEISNTLTLNNATISCDGKTAINIAESQPFTIECIGTNTITTTGNAFAVANTTVGSTTFTGSGSVNMSSYYPTYFGVMGPLKIQDGCSVTLQSSAGSCIGAGAITVDGANLVAKGNGSVATITCSGLTMENGVQIRSNHTYDATTHQFLNAAGEEAKDEIIIKTGGNYNGICIDNISIKNNSGEKVPVEGMDFGNLHAGSTYLFPFYLSIKNNADGNLPQGSQITIVCSVNGNMGMLSLILNNELKKGSTASFEAKINISSSSLKTGENSISFQVTKIIDNNNIEHTCTSDACIAHFYVNIQTALETVNMSPKGESVKFLHNGQLFIRRGDKLYNAAGSPVHQLTD